MVNRVIAGDYINGGLIYAGGKLILSVLFKGKITLNRHTVQSYEVITDEHRKSASSGLVKGAIGGAVFGGVGMLAGGLSAKNKGIYQVSLQFRDGKRSLIEIDDTMYKQLIKELY